MNLEHAQYELSRMWAEHSRRQSPSFVRHVVGKRWAATGRLQIKPSGSGDENGRQRFLPLPDLGRSKETLFAGYWSQPLPSVHDFFHPVLGCAFKNSSRTHL